MQAVNDNYNAILGYGIVLTRLSGEKLEEVRQWRNSPEVQQYMIFRKHITPEMQERWFRSVDNERNHYYIISLDGKDVGYVHIKDVESGSGELGSLIYDVENRGRGLGTLSNWLLVGFAFDVLELDSLIIHVLKDNGRSMQMYRSLGFAPAERDGDDGEVVLCRLDRVGYVRNRARVGQMIEKKLRKYDTI